MGAHSLCIKVGPQAKKKRLAHSNSLLLLMFEQNQTLQLALNRSYYPIDPRGLRGPQSNSSKKSLIISKNRKKHFKGKNKGNHQIIIRQNLRAKSNNSL